MNGRGVHKRPVYQSEEQSRFFTATSKRALWIALKHICAKDTGEYDTALENGSWFERMKEEVATTKGCE
jgi:hypothetical protein